MSASASTEEFIELLNAEQHVDLQKLKDFARHGVQPTVRGEVWLYLLGVLSDDKSESSSWSFPADRIRRLTSLARSRDDICQKQVPRIRWPGQAQCTAGKEDPERVRTLLSPLAHGPAPGRENVGSIR